ncbi:MAG: hypothetical protein Q7R43_04065, partial [Candidatus Daviesbacteria bacterium]|nr:hypothetical protein [Candidatus Daviesbacteria bacterium]
MIENTGISTPEERFLFDLYQKIDGWTAVQGWKKVIEFSRQHIKDWTTVEGREPTSPSITVPFELYQGAIYTGNELTLGLALGKGFRSRYEYEKPTYLMFGGNYNLPKEGKILTDDDLKWLVRHYFRFSDYFYGEFSYQPNPNAPE